MAGDSNTQSDASGLRRSMSEASRQIDEIIDVAEGIAAEIQADARSEADRYMEERRHEADELLGERTETLGELSGTLLEHAEQLAAQTREMTTALDRAVEGIRAASVPLEPDRVSESSEPEPADAALDPDPVPDASPPDAEPAAAEDGGPSEEALLRATQMAIAGNSREEIEDALRDEYGIDDADAVVEGVLGAETA